MSLPGKLDFYRCFHVDLSVIPQNFAQVLRQSMTEWKTSAKAVWIEVPHTRLDLVPVCSDHGFTPHHVSTRGVMMTAWLAKSPNTLPTYATHYVGAGGLVFKPNSDDILLIKSKTPIAYTVTWKLPGGLVNVDESVCEGAVREVKEEVGVEAEARGILGLRERTGYLFGMNDIYFVVLMRALSVELLPDMQEVEEAQWMNIREWLSISELGHARRLITTLLEDCSGPAHTHLESKLLHWQQRVLPGDKAPNHIHTP